MTALCGAGELVVVYSIWNPIFWLGCVELKQFSGVTGSTSCGSAKVISTHYHDVLAQAHEPQKDDTHVV